MRKNDSFEKKKNLILVQERQFCHRVSAEIIEKPKLGIWMILIPVFFVFYFWQLSRYSEGRKEFAENFLITRERVLNSCYDAVMKQSPTDLQELTLADDVPTDARDEYHDWLANLSSLYQTLLLAEGSSFEELVRNGYPTRKDYRTICDKLNSSERAFNMALKPGIELDDAEALTIMRQIESVTEKLRLQSIREIYQQA